MDKASRTLGAVCLALAFDARFAFADEWRDLAVKADDYYQKSDVISALPIYEQLTRQDPKNALFAERLAFCSMVQSSQSTNPEEREAARKRAQREVERAQSLGDTSGILRVVQDWLKNPAAPTLKGAFQEAEAAFARGDLETALTKYQEVAAADPKDYEARVFAGDVHFRRHEAALAGEWFQKAIDVDPNREIAYRYWGDALIFAGDWEGALSKYIDAVVAEPYQWKPWDALQRWATESKATLEKPNVPAPKEPVSSSGADKQVAINLDLNTGADWLVYSLVRTDWLQEKFSKQFPNEKTYRHSLAEEVEALQTTLKVREEHDKEVRNPDPLGALALLSKDGMIEPFVLLSAPDDGIVNDYAEYRSANREKLRAYLRQYVVKR